MATIRQAEPARASVATPGLRFTKMHGAGNDFVVLDLRAQPGLAARLAAGDPALCRLLADRRLGAGCDQILGIAAPRSAGAVASYVIWNADGSASGQCGNGARCVAAWLVRDGSAGESFDLDSPAATHAVRRLADGGFDVAMGAPAFAPSAVPLVGFAEAEGYRLDIDGQALDVGAVSMGNPHVVVEVVDVDAAPVARLGAALQAHVALPESANAGFAQVLAHDSIRLRVFERGVGETPACGSGACAAVAVLARRGRVARDRDVRVQLPGGTLRIHYDSRGGTIRMAGPAEFVYEGTWHA